VTGITGMSSVGLSAPAMCAAIRAGVSGRSEHPFYDVLTRDPDWDEEEPLMAALVPGIDVALEGRERLFELAIAPLRQLVAESRLRRAELARSALLLALPQQDDVVDRWQLEATFAEELFERAGLPRCPVVRIDQSGHGAALKLAGVAHEILGQGQVERCILIAADTYHCDERLTLLDNGHRLRSERSPDGFAPGEAGVALLLEKPGGPSAARLKLGRPAFGVEPHRYGTSYTSTGRGLQQAFEAILGAGAGARAAPWVLCDLNGESYRHVEWGMLVTRLAESFASLTSLVHPADCIGDVGAASGAVLIAYAAHAFARGYAPAQSALLWTSSDRGERAALEATSPG
jgi:3-oxoacyl-[acyl-carrier-protein] synthase-1